MDDELTHSLNFSIMFEAIDLFYTLVFYKRPNAFAMLSSTMQ